MSELVRLVEPGQAQNFITDELTFKDKVSGAIQVEALTNPREFVGRWNRFVSSGVDLFYNRIPQGDNIIKGSFDLFVNDLGVPQYERNKLYADFVQKVMDEFVKGVIQEDVVGLATRKLETGRLPAV